MMKKILVIIALCFGFISFAQNAPEFPKYNAKNSANIFYYNLSEIPDEIKVKKASIKNKTITALRKYNDKIKKISFLNTPKLQQIELTINALGKQLYTNRELSDKVGKDIQNTIIPIRDSIAKHETVLNETLQTFLSKKQLKKWDKYQKRKKRELLPKQPNNNNNNTPAPSMMRGRGMGMGGRRF